MEFEIEKDAKFVKLVTIKYGKIFELEDRWFIKVSYDVNKICAPGNCAVLDLENGDIHFFSEESKVIEMCQIEPLKLTRKLK